MQAVITTLLKGLKAHAAARDTSAAITADVQQKFRADLFWLVRPVYLLFGAAAATL